MVGEVIVGDVGETLGHLGMEFSGSGLACLVIRGLLIGKGPA